MHWSADDNNNVGISLDTNYLPVNVKTMGQSTNTPFVIFLAFTMNNGDTEDDFYEFNEFFELPSSMLSFCCHYNEQRRHRICLVMSISRIGWWIVQCDYQQRLWSEQCTIVWVSVCYILYVVSSYCVTPPYPLSTSPHLHIYIVISTTPPPTLCHCGMSCTLHTHWMSYLLHLVLRKLQSDNGKN